MTLSRRDVLKLGAGVAAVWATGRHATQGLASLTSSKIPIGVQLWSVRHECEKDLPRVLKAIGEMGYDAVELAHSYYGHDVTTWRELLDANGLKSCGMHLGLPMLAGDEFDKTVAFHKALDTPYMIVASLPHDRLATVPAIEETAKLFNDLADRLQPHGMKIGYHCHGFDFQEVEGRTAWEWFGRHTREDVVLQLDIGNCLGGDGDPIAMLKAFPGRSVSLHIKDHGGEPGAVFGEGDVDWEAVFQICETTGGVKQYIVEEEGREGPQALEDIGRALKNFRQMGK